MLGLPERDESAVRTTCPYCGTGCGLVAHVEGGRLTKVEGDRLHPVNHGSTCQKPLRLPDSVASPDRATHVLLRPSADHRWEQAGWDEGIATSRSGSPGSRRATAPTPIAALPLGPAADGGLLRGRQAREGLPRDEQRRLELAPLHVVRRRRLPRLARLRRPAARLRRPRAGGLRARARLERGGVPPDRVGRGARAPARGRGRDRRRPAPHADRRGGRRPPAGASRQRPPAAERAAARDRARRPARRDLRRAPHDRDRGRAGGRARVDAERAAARAASTRAIEDVAHRFGAAQRAMVAVVDGRRTSRRSARSRTKR